MKQMNIYEEANRCLLCLDAPCTKVCKTGDPARTHFFLLRRQYAQTTRW